MSVKLTSAAVDTLAQRVVADSSRLRTMVDEAARLAGVDSAAARAVADSIALRRLMERRTMRTLADSAARLRAQRRGGRPVPAQATLPPPRFGAPRWVMLRSVVIPGWGQVYNHSWFKAIGVAAGEGYLAARLLDDARTLDRLKAEVDATTDDSKKLVLIDQHNRRLDRYVARQWFMGSLLVYSLLDAYIDAHFRNFKAEFKSDPALPGGVPRDSQVRVSFGWSF